MEGAIGHRSQDSGIGDDVGELVGEQRLVLVTACFFGARVGFDDQAVRTRRDRSPRQGADVACHPDRVRRIDDDRQVGPFAQQRQHGQVEGVAGGRFLRPNPPLAQHHPPLTERHTQMSVSDLMDYLTLHALSVLSEQLSFQHIRIVGM